MNCKQIFDYIKDKYQELVDNLSQIEKLKQYAEEHISPSAAQNLEDAYLRSHIDTVVHIANQIVIRCQIKELTKKLNSLCNCEEEILKEYPDAERLLKNTDDNERRQHDNMDFRAWLTPENLVVGAILVCAVVGIWLSIRRPPRVDDIVYTEKDKDMMELVHQLSDVYDNTDRYLNS